MTATIDYGPDWRQTCLLSKRQDDSHFETVPDLVEDRGMTVPDAEQFVADATRRAKEVCYTCPARAKCKDWAMENDEEYGVWGATTPEERQKYRPTYLRIKKSQGLTITPAVRNDADMLHPNPSVNTRFRIRQEQMRQLRDKLMLQPGFTYTSKRYGTHTYGDYMQLIDLVLAHPGSTAEELAARIGKSDTWFNDQLRDVRLAIGVE